MQARRKESLPQNEQPGAVGCAHALLWVGLWGSLTALFFMLALDTHHMHPWFWPYVLCGMLGLFGAKAAHRGAARHSITIESDGFTEQFACLITRRTLWRDIRAVRIGTKGAEIDTGSRTVRVGPPLADWLRLAHMAEERAGLQAYSEAPAEELPAVPPETVALWLGIPLDGELLLSSRYHSRLNLFRLGVLALLIVAPLKLLSLAVLGVLGWPSARRRVDQVKATPTGLEVHSAAGWRAHAWGGLRRLVQRGVEWQVITAEGDLWLPPGLAERERVLTAMRLAIDAQQSGWSLPQAEVVVPETALSRMTGESADVERGLSVAQVEPEPLA